MFHGHGGRPDAHKNDLVQYFRLIDSALMPMLRDETTPMLLAGVEYLMPLYRQVNHYPHVADDFLAGNCDYVSAHEIHQRALSVVEPVFRDSRDRASLRYRELAGTSKSSKDLNEIISAASAGRIDTLLISSLGHLWGNFRDDTDNVELHDSYRDGDDDLLDVAALVTLSHGGTVYSFDKMPCEEPIVAVFRY